MHSVACASIKAIAGYAESSGQSPALIEPNRVALNYEELWTRILAIGNLLREAGIGPRETVAVLLPQGALQVLVVAGVLNHSVCAPLQPRTTVAEVEAILAKLGATALIVSPEFDAEAQAATAMGLTVLVARSEEPPKDWQIRRAPSALQIRSASSEAILLLVTSATTGSFKLVPLTGVNFDAQTAPRTRLLQLTASDRLLQMTSLCHSMGIENTFAQFLAGGVVIATGGFDSAAYLDWLRDLKPTWYDCSPTVHQAALAQLESKPIEFPVSLRFVQSAGAPLSSDVRQKIEVILRIPVLNDYGMTETGPIATDALLRGGRVPDSAGRSAGVEIGIMAPSGELMLSGEEGEIVVRGSAVFSSYYDDPDATRAAFHNGWFRTGDLGRLDEDGNLFVTGRLKEMINRGGEKILPGEIDEVFASHPAVLEVAAFAVPHPTLGEDVACAVVLRQGTGPQPSALELRRHAAERLASFKVPHRIYFVDEIPLGELGKPQRWLLAEQLSGRNAAAPTPAEITKQFLAGPTVLPFLHEIWERILDRDDLGFDEDFFEAGGDSLAAINMLAEVDQRFGSQTSAQAASFIDEPTLGNLSRLIGRPSPPQTSDLNSNRMQVYPVSGGGNHTRLFCFPGDGLEGLPFHRLAKHLRDEMDVSIVRPVNAWHSRSLFTFELSATEAAALIREAQPQGPYFLCGDCFGGVVAIETAHQLLLAGREIRVILLDTLFPGFPRFLRDWRIWMGAIGRQWRRLWTSEHPGVRDNLHKLCRRVVWSAVVPLRRFLAPIEDVPPMPGIFEWAKVGDYPFYRVRALDAPFLHILSADEPSALSATAAASRFGWRRYARGGFEERYVAFDHNNALHESNLPAVADILRRWCGISGQVREINDHSVAEN